MENSSSITLKPPVVAVLGHVDHGKTTLLDYLRKSRLTYAEAGGITQEIGAYQVDVEGRKITFIDTPGHEAFLNLRARGARVADIALLVIDAVESIKPQTVESIKIIQKEGIPVIVALNKMDLPHANPNAVKKDLLRYNIVTEDNGGNIVTVPVSAKTGKGIDDLLQAILLVAELKKVTASAQAPLEAVVIESRKDKKRGNLVTLLIKQGTLVTGDTVYNDKTKIKIRALFNDYGKTVEKCTPGTPAAVLGFNDLPHVGSRITSAVVNLVAPISSESVRQIDKPKDAILTILLKTDSEGSMEAVKNGLPKEVTVLVTGYGDVTEGEIAFSKAAKLVIIGFNIAVSASVQKLADDEGVRIRTYNIIYKLFDEIRDVVEIVKKGPQKKILGTAKIIQQFGTSDGKVAGSQIVEGRIAKGEKAELIRASVTVSDQLRIASIHVQKEEINKIEKGKLCGIRLAPNIDFEIGDVIQSYILYEL